MWTNDSPVEVLKASVSEQVKSDTRERPRAHETIVRPSGLSSSLHLSDVGSSMAGNANARLMRSLTALCLKWRSADLRHVNMPIYTSIHVDDFVNICHPVIANTRVNRVQLFALWGRRSTRTDAVGRSPGSDKLRPRNRRAIGTAWSLKRLLEKSIGLTTLAQWKI